MLAALPMPPTRATPPGAITAWRGLVAGALLAAGCGLDHPRAAGAFDATVARDDAARDGGRDDAADEREAPGDDAADERVSADDVAEAPRCAPWLTWCDEACVDLRSARAHCGLCGNACLPRDSCVDGACVHAPECFGGEVRDITVSGQAYRVHVFATAGSARLTCTGSLTAEYLVVGGGGGGGGGERCGGGGGGGGHRVGTLALSAGAVPVSVGRGGAVGSNGADSSLGAVVARGGGAGGSGGVTGGSPGSPGGSGGGAGFKYLEGGSGTPTEGNAGGPSRRGNYTAGGGGGGAGGTGQGGAGDGEGVGGAGGRGAATEITGASVLRAGGGAGRGEQRNGVAGEGGGGAVRAAGLAGTGGGGGADAPGASGVVIVRYRW